MTKQEIGPRQEVLLQALESGEYEQDKGQLRSPIGFCCLGVACDKSELGEWDEDYVFCVSAEREKARLALSTSVIEYYGFHSEAGCDVFSVDDNEHLVHMNDELNKTFPEIAQVIRENPQNYFREVK